jgi:hypothetical protein
MGIVDGAIEELAGGPLRAPFVRRLEETAWMLSLRGRAHAARQALAVARALAAPGARPSKEIPFLRVLVFRAFAPYLAPPGGSAETQGAGSDRAAGSTRIIDPSRARMLEQASREEGEPHEGGDPPLIIRP